MRVRAIGELARGALARSGGTAVSLAAFPDSPYFQAGGEILWVGSRLPAMHPRAVVTAIPRPPGSALRFDAIPARGWSAQLPVLDAAGLARALAAARRLRQALAADAPRGFGSLLQGRIPEFPLDLAVSGVRALAAAYARGDPQAVFEASVALFGVGAGFTPSGDDLAGAALFGRRMVAPRDARWPAIAGRLQREILERSHGVSAALFSDLARGSSFAPLHAAVEALALGDDAAALAAARTLAGIGHSSGWDILTGVLIGIDGTLIG